ncbi:HlyD family secretion protein [Caulobacter sp. RL271]|uniref:HlyD family efflux transporter periplasmic adaptor subunit n=1 Tax=Caulobacter segnis TaxID=88688 RepID=A0ABY4ZTF1_9CAUL|nr:HlyD family efflux transporter periplasmic adaptor subunit [Caulobacter segnis]USQ95878.1 HlyD family efflux transporter periplasmic adaptor subunit [Caulobacter segnis]
MANQVILAINSGAETERAKVSDFSANGIRNRIAEIETQLVAISSRSELERRRLDQQAQALLREAGTLNESLVLQKKQIALAQSQVDRVRPLVENGYISLIERDRRVQTVLSLQQGVSDLERQIELRRSSARDYLAQAVQVEETSRADIAQVRGSKLTLEQSLIEAEAQGASILRAPISGEIASLDIHTGEFVAAGTTVATIVAPGDLLAELLVPTSAAGFVKPGQPVRIMVDAFPFQRFGALNGRIARVSRAPVPEVAKQGATQTPAYKIIVAVDRSSLKAYGALADIKPGMRVTADLVTGRATILQQLFDPLLSAGMRL